MNLGSNGSVPRHSHTGWNLQTFADETVHEEHVPTVHSNSCHAFASISAQCLPIPGGIRGRCRPWHFILVNSKSFSLPLIERRQQHRPSGAPDTRLAQKSFMSMWGSSSQNTGYHEHHESMIHAVCTRNADTLMPKFRPVSERSSSLWTNWEADSPYIECERNVPWRVLVWKRDIIKSEKIESRKWQEGCTFKIRKVRILLAIEDNGHSL